MRPVSKILFTQLERIKDLRPNVQLEVKKEVTGVEQAKNTVRQLNNALRGEGLTKLADKALNKVITRSIGRMTSPGAGDFYGVGKDGQKRMQNKAKDYISQIKDVLRQKETIGIGKVGFASRSKLDRFKLSPKTRSPYNMIWQVLEFGTGGYAQPNIRTTGDFKDPSGSGFWYTNKKHTGMMFQGAEGAHFLFGLRKNEQAVQEDINEALLVISLEIEKILQRK